MGGIPYLMDFLDLGNEVHAALSDLSRVLSALRFMFAKSGFLGVRLRYPVRVPYTTLHSSSVQYITPKYSTLHHTPVQYRTSPYSPLHYTTVWYIALQYNTQHHITLQYITLPYSTPHFSTTQYITLLVSSVHHTNVTLHTCNMTLR